MRPLPQVLDYLLVLDFEAMTFFGSPDQLREVTEFPTLVLDVNQGGVEVARFHHYVRPTVIPSEQIEN